MRVDRALALVEGIRATAHPCVEGTIARCDELALLVGIGAVAQGGISILLELVGAERVDPLETIDLIFQRVGLGHHRIEFRVLYRSRRAIFRKKSASILDQLGAFGA